MTAMPINRSIFVDSWAWLALANRRDSWHQAAAKGYEQIEADGWLLVTSDYVLDEVITSLFKRVNFDGALKFIEALISDAKADQICLERIDEERFNYAWMLRNVYRDKADMSFTDLTSFVLMKELNISRAFTGDHHFEMANLGFDIWPKER
ncbi:MAG: PIN domain-containing protein [Methanothrix sp.]|nr:PIN domain-containing protein [Methanothrix sp.]